MHKRVEVIWKEFIPRDRLLSILFHVGRATVKQDFDEAITVRPLVFVPKSKGMSHFVYCLPELVSDGNYGDEIVQLHLTKPK